MIQLIPKPKHVIAFRVNEKRIIFVQKGEIKGKTNKIGSNTTIILKKRNYFSSQFSIWHPQLWLVSLCTTGQQIFFRDGQDGLLPRFQAILAVKVLEMLAKPCDDKRFTFITIKKFDLLVQKWCILETLTNIHSATTKP